MGRRLHRRRAATAAGPSSSASPTAAPTSAPGEVVARASLPLCARPTPRRSGRPWRRCASAAARRSPPGSRPSARPSRTPRTRGPEGRTAGQLLEAAGCRGLAPRRRPLLREARQLRREHGRGDDRRRARADGRGPAPRPRALRRRARARGPGARRGRAGRTAGSCEARGRWRSSSSRSSRSRSRLLVRRSRRRPWSRRLTVPAPAAAIGDGDEAVGVAADGTVARLAAAARRRPLPRLPLSEPPKGGRLPARCSNRLASSAPPRRAPPLHREQLLRRKRGGRRAQLGDRTALRRRLAGGAEVARGGGGPGRSVDHRARLCRPARARAARPVTARSGSTNCRPLRDDRAESACRAVSTGFAERRRQTLDLRVRAETLKQGRDMRLQDASRGV